MLALLLIMTESARAESEYVLEKELLGKLSALSENQLSLIYAWEDENATEYEIILDRNVDTRLAGKRKWSELKTGDGLKVIYREYARDYPAALLDENGGARKKILARVLDKVIYIEEEGAPKTPTELYSGEAPT